MCWCNCVSSLEVTPHLLYFRAGLTICEECFERSPHNRSGDTVSPLHIRLYSHQRQHRPSTTPTTSLLVSKSRQAYKDCSCKGQSASGCGDLVTIIGREQPDVKDRSVKSYGAIPCHRLGGMQCWDEPVVSSLLHQSSFVASARTWETTDILIN
jgi:hypothetical protein